MKLHNLYYGITVHYIDYSSVIFSSNFVCTYPCKYI